MELEKILQMLHDDAVILLKPPELLTLSVPGLDCIALKVPGLDRIFKSSVIQFWYGFVPYMRRRNPYFNVNGRKRKRTLDDIPDIANQCWINTSPQPTLYTSIAPFLHQTPVTTGDYCTRFYEDSALISDLRRYRDTHRCGRIRSGIRDDRRWFAREGN